MFRDIILGMIRHGLTLAGGALVAKGIGDAATIDAIAGGVVAAIGLAWSALDKGGRTT